MTIQALKSKVRRVVVAFAIMSLPIDHAFAAELVLPDVPMYLAQSVDPNVFMEVDDSGSMDWEVMANKYWHHCGYDYYTVRSNGHWNCGYWIDWGQPVMFTRPGTGSKTMYYMADVNDHAYYYRDTCDEGLYPKCSQAARDQDWRIESSAVNLVYYDPSVEYKAAAGYSNANFDAARADPEPGTKGYDDKHDLDGFRYHIWIDDKGFSGTRPYRGNRDNHTNTPNGYVDLWDSHIRVVVSGGDIKVETIAVEHPASNCSSLATCRLKFNVIKSTVLTGTDQFGRSPAEIRTNIANWFQFYRRRAMSTKSAISAVINEAPYFRYGLSVINEYWNLFEEMPGPTATAADYPAHNKNLLNKLFKFKWPARGTPLRTALKRTGEYYKDNLGYDSPIVDSCQKNFTILFTDGYWNGSSPSLGDVDKDGYDNTLADVARRYYLDDLSPMDNDVPADAYDNATHQHMVTFTVAFGVEGILKDDDGDGWPDTDASGNSSPWPIESGNWNNPGTNAGKIDDMWHAAYNSRGTFVSAKTPGEVVRALTDALANIADRTSSAAAVALNTGSLSTGSRVFQARFETGGWTGELLAYDIDKDGNIGVVPAWNSREKLDAKSESFFTSTRKIFTYGDASGRAFDESAAGLTKEQVAFFNINPGTGIDDGNGSARINYIRGSAQDEGTGLNLRERDHRLGDLIHSNPTYIGTPPYVYDFGGYDSFIKSNRNRQGMVYVGGNDGMLHAVNADTGEEEFAYIPEMVQDKLLDLAEVNYSHEYYVDGSPQIGDVQVGGSWATYLVGALRSGGQGVFVLDITKPGAFGSGDIKFEFTDGSGSNPSMADADLGYTYSEPQIRKMSNGKWAAVIGNGYNATESDGNASTSGHAVLFIIYLDGTGYVKLTTAKGDVNSPNGLATPAAVDLDGDALVDVVYAGDLLGNLWRFDVSKSSGWEMGGSNGVSHLYSTPGAELQAITSKPTVVAHPDGVDKGTLVWFGTGRYLEAGDDTVNIDKQGIFAVWDRLDGTKPSNLQRKHISTSAPRALLDPSDPDWSVYDGFYITLDFAGERIVTNPFARNGVVFFTTLIPGTDRCSFGGDGWLLALDGGSANPPQRALFDYNGDGLIDDKDWDSDGDGVSDHNYVSPEKPFDGIPSSPTFLIDDFGGDDADSAILANPPPPNAPRSCGASGPQDLVFTTDSSGGLNVVATGAGDEVCGRRGWRQNR